jgi:hypothetical protein
MLSKYCITLFLYSLLAPLSVCTALSTAVIPKYMMHKIMTLFIS